MGLLAPLFLGGVLAIALPIWLHRLQTKSSVRESFSSAMLLESSEQQIHVKKQLKYLALLALRIAFLLLLVLAFAQPFLSRPPSGISDATAGTHLVVVDTSLSMGRSGLIGEAVDQARRVIDAAPGDALLQVLSAADGLQILSELTGDRATHNAALPALAAETFRLDYGEMIAELDGYAETLPPPVTLNFISDFQASGMPSRFSDLVGANISSFEPWQVGTRDTVNWSIEFVRQTADGLAVGVRNHGDPGAAADVRVSINAVSTSVLSVSGSGRQLLPFDNLKFVPGDNRIDIVLDVDDQLAADNRWFTIIENDPPDPVPLLTAQPGGLAVTYLSAALESAARNSFEVTPVPVSEFDPRILTRYRWAVSDDIGALAGPAGDAVAAFLADGGNLLAFSAERSLTLEVLPVSGHRLRAGSLGSGSGEFLSVGQIDTQHPSLAATEGWHRVNVSQILPVELSADDQVLLRLENNEPLMLERRIGAGRLLLVLSSADNRWNDLPLHPVFVGFMIEAAEYLSGGARISANYVVGDSLPLSLIGSAAGQVVDPDGNAVLSLAGTARAQQIKLDKSGVYEVYTPKGETLVAVNLDPRESELEPMSPDIVERWKDAAIDQETMADTESVMIETPPLEMWHWLLLLAAVFVIGESLLANHYLAAGLRSD